MQEYLQTVEDQIRWKRAKPVVTQELARHLEDQWDAFAAEGSTPEEAERLAVEEMGDPVAVGAELDRVHRPRPSWDIFLPVILSLAVWLGFRVFQHQRLSAFESHYIPLWSCILFLAVGAMALLYFLDYTILDRAPMLVVGLVTAAGFVWFFANLAVDGLRCWTGDYLPLLLPLAMALSIYALRNRGTRGLAACCGLGLLQAVPWVVQGWVQWLWPSLLCSTALLALAVKSGWFGGKKRNWLLVLAYALVMLGAILTARAILMDGTPHSLLHAILRAQGGEDDYVMWRKQYIQDIVFNARLVGMAEVPDTPDTWKNLADWQEYMRDLLKYAEYDDMLLAILGNFGWLAFGAVQAPVVVMLAAGWRKCRRQTAVLGRLLASAILLTLTWQAAAYVVQTLLGLLGSYALLTPFPYPLVSDGGTALVIDCALLGLLASAFRSDSIVREDSQGRSYIPHRNHLATNWQNSQKDEKVLSVSLILKRR